MRSDVLVKMELLDQKHVQDTVQQLQRLISTMQAFHDECAQVLKGAEDLFPIEVNLSSTMLGMSLSRVYIVTSKGVSEVTKKGRLHRKSRSPSSTFAR